jgi:rRNA processing protein Krr1/Pno1
VGVNAGTVKLILVGGTVAVLGVLAYKAVTGAKKAIGDAIDGAEAFAEQQAANVTSWFNNFVNPSTVASEKAWLYGDYGYTGVDPATGKSVADGQWYGDEAARRYDYEQRAAGGAPAASSSDGAAFGVYPSAGKRNTGGSTGASTGGATGEW